jgi:hypothetical protein
MDRRPDKGQPVMSTSSNDDLEAYFCALEAALPEPGPTVAEYSKRALISALEWEAGLRISANRDEAAVIGLLAACSAKALRTRKNDVFAQLVLELLLRTASDATEIPLESLRRLAMEAGLACVQTQKR